MKVHSIVLKIQSELDSYAAKSKLGVPFVYNYIKQSNSSLNRKSKKLLEDSISRVLTIIKQDQADNDEDSCSPNSDSAGVMAAEKPASMDMNKTVRETWSKNASQVSGLQTPTIETPEVKITNSPKKRQYSGEPPLKRRKFPNITDRSPPSNICLRDIGGAGDAIKELMELICRPLLGPNTCIKLGYQPPRGVLLHGPPGCGKTMMANAIAAELDVPFIAISAPSIVSGMSGESEKALRDHFEEAKKLAPCLVFIDEIDAVTPKREHAQREMEKRIVAQLLTCMDDLAMEKTGGKAVVVLAATNRPDSLDPALRRGGRFDKEINLGVPNEIAREQILKQLTRKLSIVSNFPFRDLAKRTPGFVGADLNDLVSTATEIALKKYESARDAEGDSIEVPDSNQMERDDCGDSVEGTMFEVKSIKRNVIETEKADPSITIFADDFYDALPKIQPSAKREGFATIPETTWADIGALEGVRKELLSAMVQPMLNSEKYKRLGITAPMGILLWGPPGCGKTLLAKAVANESKANFISVKGPELLNKYVGESERSVRQVFQRARSSIPCVIFFDELDALTPLRDDSASESSNRVVNTFLTELDGCSQRTGIYVIAATNRGVRILSFIIGLSVERYIH